MTNNPAHLQAVREGMIGTVHGPGTATNIRPGLTYLIAGKTGTAQVVSRRDAAINPRNLPMPSAPSRIVYRVCAGRCADHCDRGGLIEGWLQGFHGGADCTQGV